MDAQAESIRQRRIPPAQESLDRLRELQESARRQGDAMKAWVDATPEGLTASEVRATAKRFAKLVDDLGPRRGLCRFGH